MMKYHDLRGGHTWTTAAMDSVMAVTRMFDTVVETDPKQEDGNVHASSSNRFLTREVK